MPGVNYGTPKEAWGFSLPAQRAAPREIALDVLRANAALLGLGGVFTDLRWRKNIQSRGGWHVIFSQWFRETRIHRAYVTVHMNRRKETYLVKNRAVPAEQLPSKMPKDVGAARARRLAMRAVRRDTRGLHVLDPEAVWFPVKARLRLAHKFRIRRERPVQLRGGDGLLSPRRSHPLRRGPRLPRPPRHLHPPAARRRARHPRGQLLVSSRHEVTRLGTGAVDDAEDGETILHEFGHALQDAICPDFGQSAQAAAMGEGFGNYLAASFFASKKRRGGARRLLAAVMTWDGILFGDSDDDRQPPCVRRVDGALTYESFDHSPRADEHDNGQIWSAALWDIWKAVGRRVADTIIIESHFQLDGFTTLARGARAIIDADRNLFAAAHVTTLKRVFRKRGIGPVE